MGTDRLTDVLDATYTCLSRYGVRRTTVDDIAGEMGVSRSAVYQYVRGKDDAVRRLTRRLHDRALDRAAAAAASDAPPAERIHGILAAKLDLVLDLVGGSPHIAELLDAKARLSGDICDAFTGRIRELLVEQFAAAETDDAARVFPVDAARARPTGPARVRPADAADICLAVVIGLETHPEAARLLPPAVDALLTGLLPAPAGPLPASK
ncbi:TetR/AcrR family transcriptional regulator [Streptomyces aureoverticillatus]|uniref:TetR/AcrR family transcriptional regulator n=1 Tax=Streptomyces aureoverticillatus TaxID=66871 RepID=UPI0013DCEE12|nr:TetR/AcrR family transcriptional regulator [Streptomyces aureoverticillatus]QIB47402.1 TetR/AcrR family transcriptional regulator [Streptomyces aureoverticillatus]